METSDREKGGATAFVRGLLSGSMDGQIEAQEARGQSEMVIKKVLPKEGFDHPARPASLKAVKGYDDLFQVVDFPEGWKVVPAPDHSMWSSLQDDKGRERAAIFYKAAFYDRNARINWIAYYNLCENAFNPEYRDQVKHVWLQNPAGEKFFETAIEDDKDLSDYGCYEKARNKVIALADVKFPGWNLPQSFWEDLK